MVRKIQIDAAPSFELRQWELTLTLWSCHFLIAPTVRLCHGFAATVSGLRGSHIDERRTAAVTSQVKTCGYAPTVESPTLLYNDPRVVIPAKAGIQIRNTASAGQSKTPNSALRIPNSRGFTLIELIGVIVIIGILAAAVLPRIDFGATSSTASVAGAANMIASDIRYTQEWAMANRTSKSIAFTNGSSTYTFNPVSSGMDPSGQLQSVGATIGTTVTFTFNSLGEPTAGGGSSVTVSAGGVTKTITVTQYTGKVSIS